MLAHTDLVSNVTQLINIKFDELTKEQQNQVAQGVLYDKFKKELSQEIMKANTNISQLIIDWAENRPIITKAQYLRVLDRFRDWTKLHNVHILDIQVKDLNHYLSRLSSAGLSLRTQRYHLNVLSSFYSYLNIEGVLSENPVRQVKKPISSTSTYFLNIPTSHDIQKIQQTLIQDAQKTKGSGTYLRQQSSKIYYAILHMCCEYGLRVGGLSKLIFTTVNQKAYWTTVSKGQEYSGPVNEKTLTLFTELGLSRTRPFFELVQQKDDSLYDAHERATRRIIKAFTRIGPRTPGLYKPFSIHSFRHYFACKMYLASKNPKKVQQALGHKSLLVTDTYLSGINFASPYFDTEQWFDLTWTAVPWQ